MTPRLAGPEYSVERDDDFAHDRGKDHFGGFAFAPEFFGEAFQDAVIADGSQGRHVERFAHGSPAGFDMAGKAGFAALVIEGGNAGQASRPGPVEGAKLRPCRRAEP